jgi:hypothetical protein
MEKSFWEEKGKKNLIMEFSINKGIGKSAEFQGLKAQYLFIFAGGLLGLFIVFVIMYLAGIGMWFCIGFSVIASLILVYGTFYLNNRYGEYGILKLQARRSHPRYVINRKSFFRLISLKRI